jgi:hypothetical protein
MRRWGLRDTHLLIVPPCSFVPEADGILAYGLSGEIVGDVPAGCEIGWGIVGSDVALVVAKDHVHNPVQGILDGPVRSDRRAGHNGQHHQRDDVEARPSVILPLISRRLNVEDAMARAHPRRRSAGRSDIASNPPRL